MRKSNAGPTAPPRINSNTFRHISEERSQGHSLRKPLYEAIEQSLGGNKKVIAYFTSFTSPVIIDDQDADMIEETLQNTDMTGRELVLMINSGGGEGLAAERIVNICRSYSSGVFSVIVPKMAKSAATMICFGAKKILMSPTSELGAIDPQIPIRDEHGRIVMYCAAHEVLESYDDLLDSATKTRGRIEPYLQQLARFDARDIRRIVSAQDLSASIAVNCLRTGVLSGKSEKTIKTKIKPFLDPYYTINHGRPIYPDVAQATGLDIEVHDNTSALWRSVWDLYLRLNYFVSVSVDKVIESTNDLYTATIRTGGAQ